MRIQQVNLYAASLALLLLVACSREESAWSGSGDPSGRRPLGVASLSAPADALPTRAAAPQTRITTTPLPTDGAVGFFMQANAPL